MTDSDRRLGVIATAVAMVPAVSLVLPAAGRRAAGLAAGVEVHPVSLTTYQDCTHVEVDIAVGPGESALERAQAAADAIDLVVGAADDDALGPVAVTVRIVSVTT